MSPRKILSPCWVKTCPNLSDCIKHKRERRSLANSEGAAHQRERATWTPIVNAGGVSCRRCGKPIPPNDPTAWDMGHGDPKLPEHTRCNRGTMGRERA